MLVLVPDPDHLRVDHLLLTATTAAVENERLKSTTDFGLVASELAWDAVLNSLGDSEQGEG